MCKAAAPSPPHNRPLSAHWVAPAPGLHMLGRQPPALPASASVRMPASGPACCPLQLPPPQLLLLLAERLWPPAVVQSAAAH